MATKRERAGEARVGRDVLLPNHPSSSPFLFFLLLLLLLSCCSCSDGDGGGAGPDGSGSGEGCCVRSVLDGGDTAPRDAFDLVLRAEHRKAGESAGEQSRHALLLLLLQLLLLLLLLS